MKEIEEVLNRCEWIPKKDEDKIIFEKRKHLQVRYLRDLYKRRGPCYMVKFGDCKDGSYDIRPMFEDQISVKELRKQVKSPDSGTLDCPLCQPYDKFDHMTDTTNRRYLCKVVNPLYDDGAIDESGVFKKCSCILSGIKRKDRKFKK